MAKFQTLFQLHFIYHQYFSKVRIRVGPILQKWREAEIWHVIIARVGHKIKNCELGPSKYFRQIGPTLIHACLIKIATKLI